MKVQQLIARTLDIRQKLSLILPLYVSPQAAAYSSKRHAFTAKEKLALKVFFFPTAQMYSELHLSVSLLIGNLEILFVVLEEIHTFSRR